MREQDRKGIETRKALGPRLPRPPRAARVHADLPAARIPNRRNRLPRDTGG